MSPNNLEDANMVGENAGYSPERAFDDVMKDLEYLEQAQANDPQSKKVERYVALTKCLAEKILAEVGGNEDEIRDANKRLGEAARKVSGSEITSQEFAQSGEPAVPNQSTMRVDGNTGLVMTAEEKPVATSWVTGEQNQ